MKTKILKIIFISLVTNIFRIIAQLFIPTGKQMILLPSQFVQNGSILFIFTIYSLFAYALIASMFLFISKKMNGNKLLQGFQYGLSCSLIWIVYLLEPLPHAAFLDCIYYLIVDSLTLIIMGLLCGYLLGENKPLPVHHSHHSLISILTITSCFVLARYVLYLFFGIYSSFDTYPLSTLWWCIISGCVVSCVIMGFNDYLDERNIVKRSILLGCFLFGMNLTLFNFFMPLVYLTNLADLALRTISDIFAVTIGCFFSQKVTLLAIQKG
ncbi:hypothetical protein [Traorella massiliensis]|uniref:hypothetical protein n=1 Tax=Traorella massiliensis TaxID=1903263 RepID=UPI0008F94160|nr:hypothetical protein [Traorella massiliensis]